jgi:hypothetical protein
MKREGKRSPVGNTSAGASFACGYQREGAEALRRKDESRGILVEVGTGQQYVAML